MARPSAHRRGYGYSWRALRKRIPHTPCTDCGRPWAKGFHLDHVRARKLGGTNDPTNLRWRCHGCHLRKTCAYDGGVPNAKREDGGWCDPSGQAERSAAPLEHGAMIGG